MAQGSLLRGATHCTYHRTRTSLGCAIRTMPMYRTVALQVMNRQSLTIFLDWLNGERGGVNVGGQRYAMRFVW